MVKWFAQLRYAWRRHGAIGLIWLAGYNGAHLIRGLARRRHRPSPTDLFDEEHGTDTGGLRSIASLDVIASPVARYAVHYEPSSAQLVRAQLDKLEIDAARFTFIDFGSGKGRVLFIAAGYPFRDVVGIEFSRELHETALRNIAVLTPDIARAGNVRCINADAASVELPQCDLVCYLNNPFGPPVITRLAERLAAHHRDYGHRIIVIYVDPRHREVFEKAGTFTILDESSTALILVTAASFDSTEIER
jgi:SAM-dependent methyltransferase